MEGPCDEFKSPSKSDKGVQDTMAAAENYFKIEFKTLLENYQEGFEQNSTPGKENGVDFKCPDCQFRSHKEPEMKKHMRKLHEKRFKEEFHLVEFLPSSKTKAHAHTELPV